MTFVLWLWDELHRHFSRDLRCKHCGGWCRWKGDGWKCGVCGHTYRV